MQDANAPDPGDQERETPPSPVPATAGAPETPPVEPAVPPAEPVRDEVDDVPAKDEPAVTDESPSVPDREPTGGAVVDDAVGASDEPPAGMPVEPSVEPAVEPPAEGTDQPVGSAVAVTPPTATTAPQPRGVWTEEQAAAFRARLSQGTAKAVDAAAGAVIEAINGVTELIRSRAANRRGGGRR